jgi:hypothetical protein
MTQRYPGEENIMGNATANESQVGYIHHLHHADDLDCDNDSCRSKATVRLTEKSGLGVSYGYYCKACLPDIPMPAKAS